MFRQELGDGRKLYYPKDREVGMHWFGRLSYGVYCALIGQTPASDMDLDELTVPGENRLTALLHRDHTPNVMAIANDDTPIRKMALLVLRGDVRETLESAGIEISEDTL